MRSIRQHHLLIAAMLATFAIVSAGAQATPAHPNFTGVWVMDTAKSPGPVLPTSMTLTIDQRGDTIKITRDTKTVQGDLIANMVYGTDGKPWKNSIVQAGTSVEVSSVLTWDGATLVITSTLNAAGQTINQVEKWSLDSAGKTLTADRTAEAMGQQFVTKLVLNKRP